MPLLLKTSIKRAFAEAFFNDIADNRNQYFLFISKPSAWAATDTQVADIIPVLPSDTVKAEYDVMRGIIGYKKIDPSKIVFALERIPWTSGNYYDAYRDDVELFNEDDPQNFYVVTDANNIYKCVGIPSPLVPSRNKPSHTSSIAQKEQDGYRWKYLATVKESELPYELVDYVPINFIKVDKDNLSDAVTSETSLQFNTQQSAVNGQINSVELVSTGGASAAIYLGSECGAKFKAGLTGSTAAAANDSLGVGNYYTISSSTNTNLFSLPSSQVSNYIGYVLRVNGVSGSGTNPSDVNKYGIIKGVTTSSNQYSFTIRGEYEPFDISYSNQSTQEIFYDIFPYSRFSGDGSGAYCFLTLGKTGETSWRKVTGVDLVDGGRNYSQATVKVVSPKSDGTSQNTVHPTLNAVLTPKGGHSSNILKELNVKDIIIVVELSEENDSDVILTDGKYRQFGIVKNPVFNDGSGVVAGTDQQYYRDLTLLYLGSASSSKQNFTDNFFSGSRNFITGAETYSSFSVSEVKSVSALNNETRVQVKVKNNGSQPIVWADRLQNYELNLSPAKSGFVVGEKITQNIPSGISAYGGISYGFGVTAEGTVLSASASRLNVRVTSNAFARGSSNTLQIRGTFSGVTALVGGVSLAYGEYAFVNRGLSLATEGGNTAELFKIINASTPYFDEATAPRYSGLTVLDVSRPALLPEFTDTTWANGDFVQQGVSASYQYDYAAGYVYKWEKTDTASGKLYLGEPFGIFKYVSLHGNTFSKLNRNSTNDGYTVTAVTAPEIDIRSGEILYINSIQPVQRLRNQSEEFRLRIGF